MASLLFSETIIYYSQALLVRLTSGSSVIRVNFHSLQKQFNASEWVSLIDMDDAEELSDTEKMILLDCTKTPLLNSLATLSNDPLVVAVLCVCREVTEEELKISAEELMSGEYPSIIFLQDKATDVAELKQLLLLNPQEVECSISEGQTLSPIVQDQARKRSSESSFSSGLEAHAGQGKSKIRESVIHDILDNLLFVKVQEDDLVPLVLCRHPQTITLIINFIYQRVDSQVHEKKDSSRSSLNKIVKYLKSKVIFESHVQVDWPIYLVVFLEVLLLYDSSKENQAIEAIDYILTRFLKLNPDVIAYSIRRFEELTQDKVFCFRKLGNPKSELIDLFSIQYTQSQKTGNKFYNTKPICKQQDLENKLLWYNVLMLCNQSFKIPGHSKWNEHLIKHIDYDQLSIYDSSNLNTIWESGIQFGIKLGLSFVQRFLLSHIVSWISSNVKTYTFQNFIVETDASNQAIGAVLSQVDDHGHKRSIEFYSSSLSPAQRKYSAGELEAWAIVAALRKWRTYLQAAPKVEIVTDHNPLTWLRRQRDPRNKFARWILELETYNYEIRYRNGLENGAADWLSRSPCKFDCSTNDESENFERNIYTLGAMQMGEKVRRSQLDDKAIRETIKQLSERGRICSGQFRAQEGMRVNAEGVLYRKEAIIVPSNLQDEVTVLAHRLTHAGIERTYQAMKGHFFWVGMRKYVERCCNTCIVCLENKRTSKKREPLCPIEPEVPAPRSLISADVATLPWSEDGYRYMLVIVDLFSKFVEIIAMRDQSADAICEALETGWFYRHGIPRVLLTDQGRNVDGKSVRELCENLGIQKRHSSAYHPQGDGQAERTVESIKQSLRCLLAELGSRKSHWPTILHSLTTH